MSEHNRGRRPDRGAMRHWLKWALALAFGLIVAIVGALVISVLLFMAPTNDLDNTDPARQEEMVQITLKWGRLVPFPKGAQDFSISTEGNMFTRSFRASFTAPVEEIREWIVASPGLAEAQAEVTDDGERLYTIRPGGGANRAEVTIDFAAGRVEVYVSWS